MTSPQNEKLKVLVVDDDEMNRRMMHLILSREEHYVELASDGFEACEAAEKKSFDIILMDLQMPKMDGVETSRRIRVLENGTRHAYIVALTASYLPEKGNELFEAGIDNYIAKPFDVMHLRQILKHGLDHRQSEIVYEIERSRLDDDEQHQAFDPAIGIKQVGGDEELFRELLAGFIKELPLKVDRIEKSLAEKDMDGLSRGGHNLKGVSSNLGALQLSQYAGRLENRASEGYTELVISDVKLIKTISGEFIRDASNFLGKEVDQKIDFAGGANAGFTNR